MTVIPKYIGPYPYRDREKGTLREGKVCPIGS